MADTLATLAASRANLTKTTDFSIEARKIDFVSRFTNDWTALREVMNIASPIKKVPGTILTAVKASITLEDGNVPEGAVIPYSKAKVEPVSFADLTILKYGKAVSIEDVNKYGAKNAIQSTDDAFLAELQGIVLDEFFDFLQTGQLTGTYDTFQKAIAMAIGSVIDKFKKMRKNSTGVVLFVNTLDAYEYLGIAEISNQTGFGLQYVQNFMGARTMILSSEIPRGKVIATPSENMKMYYIDPNDSEYRQLGLNYITDGETNLIGFAVEGNFSTAVGESWAIMGVKLWAEYLDGIAVMTIEGSEE